jgi:hypothetical protein
MLIILNGLIISSFLFSVVFFRLFKFVTRYSVLKETFFNFLSRIVNAKVGKFLVLSLFVSFFLINLSGNIPLNRIPTLFYSQTLTVSLLF